MPSASLESLQIDALFRVGRNLARFQLLEKHLKQLLPTMRVSGTLQEAESQVRSHAKRLKNATLGVLAESFGKSILSPAEHAEPPQDLREVHISYSWSLQTTPERAAAFRKRWRELVRERNMLVHRQLLEFNLALPDECRRLSLMLDEQCRRVDAMLDETTQLRRVQEQAVAAQIQALATEFGDSPRTSDGA